MVLALHFLSLYMAFHGMTPLYKQLGLAVEKVFFSTVFYYAGCVYAQHLEKWDAFSFNKLIALTAFNGFLLGFVSNNIHIDIAIMKFPTQIYWLPLVAAVSGIWFCLQLAELLKEYIREDELLSYIGRHSWDIMMHHVFFFWTLNTFFLCGKVRRDFASQHLQSRQIYA